MAHFNKLKSCAVEPGDILLSLVGTAGRVLVIPPGAPQGIINPRLIRFSFDQNVILPSYFRFIFESEIYQTLLARSAQGGTMGVLNAGLLRPISIPLPSLAEQRAISAALSDVDALIAALDRLIAKKRDIKQAAMQELLTGKRRLPGFSGKWEMIPLGEVAPLQRGFDLPTSMIQEGAYPVVYSNGVLNHHAAFQVKGPGVITGRSGTIGRVTFIEHDFWPHNTTLWVTSFKGNNPRFVYYLYTRIGLDRFATGSGVPTLNRNDVHAFKVRIPTTNNEQTAIATVLSEIDADIAALEARRMKTHAIKQGMMQELLTGRIRLVQGAEA